MSMTPYAALHARIASRLAVIACGVSVTAIGWATIIGYWLGFVRFYQWDPTAIGMAPNTAVGFVLSGLGISLLGASNRIWRCS